MKLEKICLHKGKGCNKESTCDGRGKYYEETIKYCKKEVYSEIGLWRTDHIYYG